MDARDSSARTALHAAALAERSQCLEALCAAGANVDACQDEKTGGKVRFFTTNLFIVFGDIFNVIRLNDSMYMNILAIISIVIFLIPDYFRTSANILIK